MSSCKDIVHMRTYFYQNTPLSLHVHFMEVYMTQHDLVHHKILKAYHGFYSFSASPRKKIKNITNYLDGSCYLDFR